MRNTNTLLKQSFRCGTIALLACSLVSDAHAELKINTVSQVLRPNTGTAVEISGITWAGGDLYYAVDDKDKKLYPLTLKIDPATGKLATSNIVIGTGIDVSGANDMEGCAFDPASGNVWVCEEPNARIREVDPATGAIKRTAPVPAIMKQYYGNFSLEALTISGDGLTMWTCNEESLKVDGTNSTKSVGAVVRLTRFTRKSVADNWNAAGQWAYQTEPIGTDPWGTHGRSGVSGLVALPDGTLLVLERTLWGDNFLDSTFYTRIYEVDPIGATEVSSIQSLKNATYTKVKKKALFNTEIGWVNYEGICLGPRLKDGTVTLIVVADGGDCTEKIMTMKLSGIDVRTLTVEKPVAGGCSLAGGPYRYVAGRTVDISLSGIDYPSAYTNNTAVCTNVAWQCGSKSGNSSSASFTISEDATFKWNLTPNDAVSTPIDFADNFERYEVGALVEDGEVGRWTGNGEIVNGASATAAQESPMAKDPHTKVLEIDNQVKCSFLASTTNANDTLEMLVTITHRRADEDNAVDGLLGLMCDETGKMNLYCFDPQSEGKRTWVTLSDKVYAGGDWVRIFFRLAVNDAGEIFVLPRLDGIACKTASGVHSPADPVSPGAWYKVAEASSKNKAVFQELEVNGSVMLDDVIKGAEGYESEIPESIANAQSASLDGVPLSWLKSTGLGMDPNVPVSASGSKARVKLHAAGYTVGDIYLAGLDPAKDEPFNFTGINLDDDGRLVLTFNGIDRTKSSYGVYYMEELGGAEKKVPGTVTVDTANYTTTWTSTEAVDDRAKGGFYVTRIRASPCPD
ncbi:MAG: esterase-like activity of phytase family protein [Kiritimatiellae bacterium]|nr:esterase-like activity of phytase family protein [Kiritimatiellia bacterium]